MNYKEYVTARLLELTELVQLVSQKFGLSAIFFPSFLSYLFRILKLIYSEKATNFGKVSTVDLSYLVMVKSRIEISQNFLAFSEYMNFTYIFPASALVLNEHGNTISNLVLMNIRCL